MGTTCTVLVLLCCLAYCCVSGESLTALEVREQVQGIVDRVESFQEWSARNPAHLDACDNCGGKLRRDAGINKLEVHLVKFVGTWMKALLKRQDAELINMYSHGHECTAAQAASQANMYKNVRPHICSENEVYKIAQLAMPELKTFVDVGANRGFIGSMLIGMWGGHEHRITPAVVSNHSLALDLYPNNRNPFGYCRTGLNHAYPIYCPEGRRKGKGECMIKRDVRVFSIDGSSNLKRQVGSVIRDLDASRLWSYDNYAISNTIGFTQFTRQNATHMSGLEGGTLNAKGDTETVPMTTIDAFLEEAGFTGVVDVIKIDAESHDLVGLLGARKTIERGTKIITYEHSRVANFTLGRKAWEMFRELKFSCYSAAFKLLYKMDLECLEGTWLHNIMKFDWGNIYCASQVHAPAVVAAFDAISFLPIRAHEKTLALEAKAAAAEKSERLLVRGGR